MVAAVRFLVKLNGSGFPRPCCSETWERAYVGRTQDVGGARFLNILDEVVEGPRRSVEAPSCAALARPALPRRLCLDAPLSGQLWRYPG